MRSLRDALEAALVDNPDDLATHYAYADYLQEQGDPRGEFIHVQLALEDPKRTEAEQRRLQARAGELIQAHQREWLGILAEELLGSAEQSGSAFYGSHRPPLEFQFARGWLDALTLHDTPEARRTALPSLLGRTPEARLLRRLTVEFDEGSIQALLAAPALSNLRQLQLGRPLRWEDYPEVAAQTGTVPALLGKLPRLEELRLFVNDYDVSRLFSLPTLTSLRVLQVYNLSERYPLEKLAENPALAHLTHLLLHPAHFLPPLLGPFVRLDGVRALVQSPYLRNLSHLQLHYSDVGDVGCSEIVTSGILKRLKVLDLRHGEIGDSGARTLADCPDLRNLKLLDVGRNALTQTGIDALCRVLGSAVRVDNQQTAEELAQRQYLYQPEFG
jgi:uncharacterized protein (TIGR02996 family)